MRGLERGKSPEAVRHLSVREISLEEAERILSKQKSGAEGDANRRGMEETSVKERFLNSARGKSKRAFLLAWEGVSIPRGAVVDNKTIGDLQHDRVFFVQNTDTLGVYERVVQSGGRNGEKQEVILFLF